MKKIVHIRYESCHTHEQQEEQHAKRGSILCQRSMKL